MSHHFEFVLIVAEQLLDPLVWRNELHLILLANYLSREFGLIVFLANVPRLIIEKSVRVSHPGH